MAIYRIIIADDEQHIRESLASLVNWQEMGFEVVGLAANGRDVMASLLKLHPDVLLMDIKMPFMTGLDVAQHIHVNKLPIRVILLSGFQEFHLAQEATNTGVFKYLLKPTKLEEVRATFAALRQALDEQHESTLAFERMVSAYNDSLRMLRFQTLRDLLYLPKPEPILQQVRLMGNPLFLRWFCLFHLTFANLQAVLEEQWQHERDLFDAMLLNVVRSICAYAHCSIYPVDDNSFLLVVNCAEQEMFGQITTDFLPELRQLFPCEQTLRTGTPFEDLAELRAEFMRFLPRAAHLTDSEYGGLLLTAILENETARLDALVQAVLLDYPASEHPARIAQTYARLLHSLRDLGLELPDTPPPVNVQTLQAWMMDSMAQWRAYSAQSSTAEQRLVQRIKKFMQEHLHEDLSLRRVADHVYLSPVYVSRLFKQATGENFIDAMQRMRVEKACRMLRNPELRIYEIATATGYRSAKYFMRVFKEYTRTTPTEYRKQVLHQEAQEDA